MSAEQTVDVKSGVIAAFLAYSMWGVFPLMFRMLADVPSALIVAHRVVWALLFVMFVLWQRKRLAEVWATFRDFSTLRQVFFGTIFLTINWLFYVWSVESGQVLATSFGYFINPLVNVILGMVLLGERQNAWQWAAIGIAFVGIAIQAVGIGGVPWLSLVVATTFGIYGYFRKTVKVGSAPGLAVETLLLTPFAMIFILFSGGWETGGIYHDGWTNFWLIATGPATAGALLFFAYAARQLRLTTLGMFQYLAPSIQFLIAVFVFKEHINTLTFISFLIIWLSLVVYTYDSLRNRRRPPAKADVAKV